MKEFGQFINEHSFFVFGCWLLIALAIICVCDTVSVLWRKK